MDMSDLEEGEAYHYADDDQNIDPDEAFSYIDERIHDVLGHYLKDFEGGFSAESLGARFGGYGSFLPAYRRSPSILPHPKIPQEVGSHSIPRPLHNHPYEGAHQNSMILLCETRHVRHEPDSDRALPPLVSRTSMDSSDKPLNPSNHKMLKVRIKMGSERILAQKNAEIYSGLGLDMSSSSSLEERAALCKGNLVESQETLGESPSWIIKMMTSFPFPDGVLLSPLEDSLVHLLEEENYPKNTRSRIVQESSAVSANEFAPEKGSSEVFQKKKLKLMDKNRSSVEMINESCEDPVNVIDTHPKREIDAQNSIDKEIVSSALKLQLTFDKKDKVHNVEGIGSTSKAKMEVLKHRIGASNLGKEGVLELISHGQANKTRMGNAKTGLFAKDSEDKRAGLGIRDGEAKVDSGYVSSKVDYDIPKAVKGLAGGTTQPASQKFDQKAPSHLQNRMKIPHGEEHPSSEGKKKLKGSQSDGRLAAKSPKESLMAGSSMAPKVENACSSYFPAKVEGNDVKSYQDLRKVRDYPSNFVGKMKLGKKKLGIIMDMMETPLKDGGKLSKIGETKKEMKAFSGKSKERSDGKKAGSLSTFDVPLKCDLNEAALTENRPNLNVFPTEAAPVLIKENWVCCDKCHKWRLLPYGTNPNHLPKKWLCSMLNWLPGMNKCSFSEEETTNALNALYQVPISDIPINELSCPDRVESEVTLASSQHNQIPQEVGFNAVPSGGKKKQGSRAMSDADDARPLKMKSKREAIQDGFGVNRKAKKKSMHYTDVVQNPGGSTKQTRIDDQKYNEHSSPWYSQDLAKDVSLASIETQKNSAEKLVAREEYISRDISGRNRKLKGCQDTQTYPGTPLSKPKQTKIDDQKANICCSHYLQAKDGSLASKEKQNKLSEKIVSKEELGKKDISSKKRKLKDFQGTQIFSATPLSNKHQTEIKAIELNYQENAFNRSKETDRQDRKDKANRIILLSNGNSHLDDNEQHKRGSIKNDRLQGQYHGSKLSISTLDGKSSLGKDLGSGQPFVATTSSSSKVSATCKIKVSFRKVKGSPVESVSSAPLRISNPDNLSKSLLGLDDASSAGFSLTNSQRRGSGGKCDDDSDRSETVRKEKKDLHPMESLKYNVESKLPDCTPYKEEMENVKFKTQGDYNIKSEKVQKSYVGRKVSPGTHLNDCRKRGYRSESEQHKDPHAKLDTKQQEGKSTAEENLLQNHENERPSSWRPSNRVDDGDSRGGKLTYFTSHCSIHVSEKFGGFDVLSNDGSDGQDGAETQKQPRKAGSHNEFHQVSFRLPTPGVYVLNDIESQSPLKKDTSSCAADNALKEAKDLKHSANRLKISGSGLGSTELFFQAALKFLHGALLLEHCNTDTANYGEMTSMEAYGTTAKLCEYCAHEFERCQDMASAALAYKCVEVSYMRLIYSNDFIASRDCHELQMALQMVPSVESPSSSASGVDDLNNRAIMDKTNVSKGLDLPQLTGNHVVAARNQPHFVRLLNFAQDVNIAMDASRKSQDAFAAASVVLAEAGNSEGISSVKRVLDFSFHDLEGLLRLVHHTMETLNG